MVLDANRDGTRDLVFYTDGILQVFLHSTVQKGGPLKPDLEMDLQPPEPFDPNKPWDPPLRLVASEDLNGDGYFDLVFTKNSEADSGFNTRGCHLFAPAGPDL